MNRITDNRNWQMSLNDSAAIVEGVADIEQCIYTLLATVPGTDPLRPTFGSNLYLYLDRPIAQVRSRIVFEATEAIKKWEPRVEVTGCKVISTLGSVQMQISGTVVESAEPVMFNVEI